MYVVGMPKKAYKQRMTLPQQWFHSPSHEEISPHHSYMQFTISMLWWLTLGTHAQRGYSTWSVCVCVCVCVCVRFPVLPSRGFRCQIRGISGYSADNTAKLKNGFL